MMVMVILVPKQNTVNMRSMVVNLMKRMLAMKCRNTKPMFLLKKMSKWSWYKPM